MAPRALRVPREAREARARHRGYSRAQAGQGKVASWRASTENPGIPGSVRHAGQASQVAGRVVASARAIVVAKVFARVLARSGARFVARIVARIVARVVARIVARARCCG